ncbi:MAG: DUF2721 domain-containing protein [Sphingomonadales bacterium]|nr:MAG: DUF2721 domain-containing protein [Sphingomonadales bacterium]
MLIDLLPSSANLAAELLERTASTVRVQEIVRLSLAPAFLLAGIGAIMNVMMTRLIWVAERIERLEARIDDDYTDRELQELAWLRHRRTLAQRAVMFSTSAALTISVVIALLFFSAFIKPQIGTATAAAWILTMSLLFVGLVLFARETVIAARGHRAMSHGKSPEEPDAE